MKKVVVSLVVLAAAFSGFAFADEYYCNIEQSNIVKSFIYNPAAGSSCERIKRTGSMAAYEACVQKNEIEKKLYEENISSCPQLYREHFKVNESHCSVRYVKNPVAKIYDKKSSGVDGEACLNALMDKLKSDYPQIEE